MRNKSLLKICTLFIILNFCLFILTAQEVKDSTTDESNRLDSSRLKSPIIDRDYNPDESLKRQPAVFDFGGVVSSTSRVYFKYFQQAAEGGFEPVPNDRWYADIDGRMWGRILFKEERFIHLGVRVLFKFQRNDFGNEAISLVPMFNINELYLHWTYPIGKVIIGRTNYNLMSAMIFSGPLDGLELDINIPYLNFKSFLGFTGLLGIFNPWFNPYYVTSMDRQYEEETNLLIPNMIIKINENQARRFFFATDFDINFFGQHINPYFLMQYDMTSLYYNMNNDLNVNTFHLGLNIEGRIIKNFYYKAHLSGLFGTHPSSQAGVTKPIVACALETNIRYTIPVVAYSTFMAGYALGTGNDERFGRWSDYPEDAGKGFWSDKYDGNINRKFYYFGKFDGGYVLNPILSNIHSISLKYLVTPYNNGLTQITIYIAFYQTIRLYPTGPISDDECTNDSYLVGSELDTGLMANLGAYINIGLDFGFFIPQTELYNGAYRSGYDDKSLRFRMGLTLGATF